MLATLTAALLLAAPPAVPADKDAPAAKVELFGGEGWYKNQKGEEREFVGVLSKAPEPTGGAVGIGRFNLYRLTMHLLTMKGEGKSVVREVYAGGHPELLAPYVGKKVKLIGKAVDTAVEGRVYAEIWPARLEVVETPAPPGLPPEIPRTLDLLRENKVYMADPTPEKDYVGVLQKKKGLNAVGYRLIIDRPDSIDREDIHLFNDNDYARLDPYNGLRVKITGKHLTGIIRGMPTDYILPGRLEVVSPAGEKPAVKELKVLARTDWNMATGMAPTGLAIRNPEQLALAHGEPPDKATLDSVQERDATLIDRMFKVEQIDWKTQMIVVVTAGAKPTTGYSVGITGLDVHDEVLTVHWSLTAPELGDFVKTVVTHPGQAVLTERFEGKVVFVGPPKVTGRK